MLIMNTIKYLSARGHRVSLFFTARSALAPGVLSYLMKYCEFVKPFRSSRTGEFFNIVTHPLTPFRTSRRLSKQMQLETDSLVYAHAVDVVLIEHQNMAAYLRTEYLERTTCVVRFQSLAYKAYFRTAAHSRFGVMKLVNIVQGFASKRFEHDLLHKARFHEAWFLLDGDVKEACAVTPAISKKGRVLPIGVESKVREAAEITAEMSQFGPNDKVILFVGSMANPTNQDGARWLANDVLPQVRTAVPEARLCVVGRDAKDRLSDIEREGVVIVGDAPDLTPYLTRANVYAVAERGEVGIHVSGVHVKLLDGLSAAKVIVASPVGTGGIDVLIEGVHYLSARDEREFVEQIVGVLQRPGEYARIAQQGFALFNEHFSVDVAGRAVEERLLSLTSPAKSTGP